MRKPSRRGIVAGGGAVALGSALTRPTLAQPKPQDTPTTAASKPVVLNDASNLNPTPVHKHWVVAPKDEADLVERLRAELKSAAAEKRPVAVGGARHSMGGQSLPRDGLAISMRGTRCEVDRAARTFRVGPGTRWSQVIATLDPLGFSPAVMQSNHDFTVAATYSVNAHGWPVPYGPFGATVRSIQLMLADGSVVTASRKENEELFRLAMGGYGLVGVVLSLECDMMENLLLRPRHETMPSRELGMRMARALDTDKSIRMAYGRLSVHKSAFLEQSMLITYRPEPTPAKGLPKASAGGIVASVSREVYRAQVGSETAKRARWIAETVISPKASSGVATRNTLMNEPVSNLASRDRTRTDILHEYFVAPEQFAAFIDACRDVIGSSRNELLNVTLRFVDADAEATLSFSPVRRIAAVMSFSQERTAAGEAEMARMTAALIDRITAIGGTFYLPYRLHASRPQVAKAYANAGRFADRKRHYDPGLVFRHAMWQAYFA